MTDHVADAEQAILKAQLDVQRDMHALMAEAMERQARALERQAEAGRIAALRQLEWDILHDSARGEGAMTAEEFERRVRQRAAAELKRVGEVEAARLVVKE